MSLSLFRRHQGLYLFRSSVKGRDPALIRPSSPFLKRMELVSATNSEGREFHGWHALTA